MSLVPFDDRDGWIWFDGEFVPWRDAKVHILTHGLHYASSVFEGARMYGRDLRADRAFRAPFRSAELLDYAPLQRLGDRSGLQRDSSRRG